MTACRATPLAKGGFEIGIDRDRLGDDWGETAGLRRNFTA
jgi:hypothetical protein